MGFETFFLGTSEVGSGAAKKGSDDEIEIIEDEEDEDEEIGEEVVVTAAPLPDKLALPKEKLKAKLLQFHDNQRPPYWGTWQVYNNKMPQNLKS